MDRRRPAAVYQCRNFGVGIDGDETAAKLIALVDPDQPGVVLGAAVPRGQKFFQQHSDLDAIGCAQ